jgi:hypothetical protein
MMKSIIAMTITALMAVGMTGSVLAANGNNFNITVNCNSGTQVHKHQAASTTTNNVNISVNCSSTGGTPGIPGTNGAKGDKGDKGDRGSPGQNATITVITTGDNSTTSPLMMPPLVK